jgi:hypothetical protein
VPLAGAADAVHTPTKPVARAETTKRADTFMLNVLRTLEKHAPRRLRPYTGECGYVGSVRSLERWRPKALIATVIRGRKRMAHCSHLALQTAHPREQ